MAEINKPEILNWLNASDTASDVQTFSSHIQTAALAAERHDRALLVDTAIRIGLLEARDNLQRTVSDAQRDITLIDAALGTAIDESPQPLDNTPLDPTYETSPVTIILRGLHKIGDLVNGNDERNQGYLLLRENIKRATGTDNHHAGFVATLLTQPGRDPWPTAQTYRESFTFYPEDKPEAYLLHPRQRGHSDRYPKAVTVNSLTLESFQCMRGIGPAKAEIFIRYLRFLTTTRVGNEAVTSSFDIH